MDPTLFVSALDTAEWSASSRGRFISEERIPGKRYGKVVPVLNLLSTTP
jgi:hypothetical protein